MTKAQTIEKLNLLKAELKKVVFGRDKIIDSLVLALASNEHILIVGKHGEAKSYSVNKLNQITDLNSYSIQLHRETTLKDIVGLINPSDFQKGKLDLIKTKFWKANVLFCDEFLRARSEFLDFLLEVMVERKTTKTILGETDLPIISVIATTNPLTEEYNTERLDLALKDRFFAIIDLKHMVEDNRADDIKKVLNDGTEETLKKVALTPQELIDIKKEARKIKVEDGIIVDLFLKLKEDNFPFSTRTIKLFKHVLQTYTMINGKDKVSNDEFFTVAKLMFANRYENLTDEKIEETVDDCLIFLEHKETIKTIDGLNKMLKDAEGEGDDKKIDVFIEKSVELIHDTKEDYPNYPKRLKDKLTELTKSLKKVMLENPDKINNKVLEKLDTERFKDVFETFIDSKTVETKYMTKGQLKDVHNIVKNIKNCVVEEKKTEDYTKYIISPKVDNKKSFIELASVEKQLSDKNLLADR